MAMKSVIQLTATAVLTCLLVEYLITPVRSHAIGASINTDFSPRGSQSAHRFLTDAQWKKIFGRRPRRIARRVTRGASGSRRNRHRMQHLGETIAAFLSSANLELQPSLRSRRDTPSSAIRSTTRYSSFFRPGKATLGDISTGSRTGTKKSSEQEMQDFSIRTLADAFSRTAPSTNPFLRVRRDAPASSNAGSTCSPPANLPTQVRELNSFLDNSDYISVIPEQGNEIELPTDQPDSCPAATGSWWPRNEVNLRSTCPWVWEELDNGEDAYPR